MMGSKGLYRRRRRKYAGECKLGEWFEKWGVGPINVIQTALTDPNEGFI